MNGNTERFFKYISGKKVAFLGIGVSNAPLIKMFAQKGARVTACDKRDSGAIGKDIVEPLEKLGVNFKLGPDYLKNLDFDIIYRTPGMKFHLPELDKARSKGIAVTSEMETFFELCPAKIIAVTGSDGKTTTSTLIAKMLEAEGHKIHLGGNIGRPLLPIIEEISPEDYVVAELSSFQLISMRQSPDIAVLTNIAPNHLDIHKDMEEYIDAKKNIFLHQNAFSKLVLNMDNSLSYGMKPLARGQTLAFSRVNKPEYGASIDSNNQIFMNSSGAQTKVMDRADIKLRGDHNVENYLAAISAVWGIVGIDSIVKVARDFGGVEHRMEFVRELNGVKWYNDSIATNPTRTIAGLNAFDKKITLIAGGYDKQIPFAPLIPKIIEKVNTLILIGATAEKIESELKAHEAYDASGIKIFRAETLENAVKLAKENSAAGDIVSMSPACASFDMFKNFEERGNRFKLEVNSL